MRHIGNIFLIIGFLLSCILLYTEKQEHRKDVKLAYVAGYDRCLSNCQTYIPAVNDSLFISYQHIQFLRDHETEKWLKCQGVK